MTIFKDISAYIPEATENGLRKRSMQSLIGKPIEIIKWEYRESKYKDGNPSGRYVVFEVVADGVHFAVSTGSAIVLEQLTLIEKAMVERGETEAGFRCIPRRAGKGGVKLCTALEEQR